MITQKIVILGDTHFGIRNGSKVFSNYYKKFYDEVFFPFLLQNKIKTVVQLGDLMDNRKSIPVQSITDSKKYFFDKFDQYDIQLISFLGNHDILFKDTLEVNSPSVLLKEYKNITIIDKPCTITINNTEILVLPWICQSNYKETMDLIQNTTAQICFGHLELAGFAMYKGVISEEGMNASVFQKFEKVVTGHYHSRSNIGNIHYTGVPYEMTWSDYNDQKGFYTFDLTQRNLKFEENPYKIFHKIFYDDTNEASLKDKMNQLKDYADTYIKLIIHKKENPYLYDLFIDELYKANPIDITIIEDTQEVFSEELKEIDETQDTLTTLYQYIDNLNSKDLDFNKLKNVVGSLYNEAISLDK